MEEIIYNSYEKDVAVYGDFEMPVPTYELEKQIDFSVILALLLVSNSNRKEDTYRYIDYSRINKREICEECKISRYTLERRLKYLEEKNIITLKNTKRGLTCIINYSKNGRYYVSIQHRILKALNSTFNKNIVKTYILLNIQCEYLKNTRPMTNAFLCSQLGYATNNERNLTNMGQWTSTLANCGFIEKIQNRVYVKNEDGKNIVERVDTYYKINPLEVWEKRKEKGVINV
ncbi:hypothetical protein [Romboutsia sp.]|uniref:hypothetical protein n=1 Tax=Romboutsia sp. TaxID=1965302 RepID=UPI002C8426ED|nr:hypothetical protein [Romboutsia sp.]HSQ87764.1 hypothetical protein [Romboutsia sp.]